MRARAVPPRALEAWLAACRVAGWLEASPPFPAAVLSSLHARGVRTAEVLACVLREIGTRRPVDHGDDDLAFLVQRVASEAALGAEQGGAPPAAAPCMSDLRLASSAGASLADVAAALSRLPARPARGAAHDHPAEA